MLKNDTKKMDIGLADSSIYTKANIQPKWWVFSFADLRESAQEVFKTFAESPENIFLHGKNGTGKTLTMNVLLKGCLHYAIEKPLRNFTCYVIDVDTLTDAYIKRNESTFFETLCSANVLGIDDIGDTYLSSSNSKEFTLAALNRIIRRRAGDLLPTIVTAEKPIDGIALSIGNRLGSFLMEEFTEIEFSGTDKRREARRKKVI